MNKFIKTTIFSVAAIIILGNFAGIAFAQSIPPLSVTFAPNPLFSVANFMPGDNKEAEITVGNNSVSLQNAYIEAVNVLNGDNLAKMMNLKIFEGESQIYDDNFGTFLDAGPVPLSSIGPNSSETYSIKITFFENTGDDYQGKTLGFDICVGFSGGNERCTRETAVSPEQGAGDSSAGPGSSSGSSRTFIELHPLQISNENVMSVSIPDNDIETTIEWDTSIPSTSQVVYGLSSGAPYPFDINNLPTFGYTFATEENLGKVLHHSVLLEDLIPGETYVYRVVSRASPPTISFEREFTVPLLSQVQDRILVASAPLKISADGSALENNESKTEVILEDEDFDSRTNLGEENREILKKFTNLAAVFTSGFGDSLSKYLPIVLLILLAIYFIWKFILKPKHRKH